MWGLGAKEGGNNGEMGNDWRGDVQMADGAAVGTRKIIIIKCPCMPLAETWG